MPTSHIFMPGLREHVQKELSMGTNPEKLLEQLMAGGWPEAEIRRALLDVQEEANIKLANEAGARNHRAVRHLFTIILLAILAFMAIAYMIGGE